jgi:hypothetical protein
MKKSTENPMKQIKNLDEFIEQAKVLREQAEEAEARFLLFLRAFERSRPDLWKTAGVQTFDSFLQSAALVNPARYRNFVSGVDIIPGAAERIGAGAMIAAASFKDPLKVTIDEYVKRCSKFREYHGVSPSEQTARNWVRQLEPSEPSVVTRTTRIHQLEAEVQQLRAQVRQLTREKADLEKQLGKAPKKKPQAA